MSDFTEAEVRELMRRAVDLARRTTPENVCDGAVVQWTLHDEFIEGEWVPMVERPVAA